MTAIMMLNVKKMPEKLTSSTHFTLHTFWLPLVPLTLCQLRLNNWWRWSSLSRWVLYN